MRLVVALAFVMAACSAAPALGPGPGSAAPATASAAPAMSGSATRTPAPTETVARVGAPIDLHRFTPPGQLGPGWVTEWREPDFAFTRLVPSWHAQTPEGTAVGIEVQGRRASGGETDWYSFGRWSFGDETHRRTSEDRERDADARVETDTLIATAPLVAYRIRVTPGQGQHGTPPPPVLGSLAAVVSDDAAVRVASPSPHGGVVKDIAVPQYSQMIHRGEYPQWGSGGEAWCSPTSTLMVLKHWGRGPTKQDVSWVDPRYADPEVAHAARFTYDSAYGGTGNWSFNVAYAAQYGVNAFVTRLRSLAEAERFIAAGIPLVASVKIAPGALPGFLLPEGSDGHLLVIRGFTGNGDVISNDPAANSNAEVRRVYPRAAFERVWMGGSGGIVYVIHPPDIALPPRVDGATANW